MNAEGNEALVARIQNGERELLPELWAQVERFISQQARQRSRLLRGIVPEEDLYQSGYLALVDAVETFDPSMGMSFVGWLALHLKTAFSEAAGYRSEKQRRDPIHRAASLDLPIGDDADGETLADTVADPNSLQGFQEAEDRIWVEQLHAALDQAMERLPEGQAGTLRRRFYHGQTLGDIAATEGVTRETVRQREVQALRILRRPGICRELREFVEERTPYYLHVGVSRFSSTGSSAVEEIAMRRERLLGGLSH